MFSKSFVALSVGKKTALLAIFIALSVVANMFSLDVTPSFKVTFTYTVCFFAAMLMGAVPAFAVGFIGDAIGYLLRPSGVYWLFGFTLGLYGFIAGIVMNYVPVKGKAALIVKTLIAFAVCYVTITLAVNSVVNYYYVKIFIWNGVPTKTFLAYFAGRVGLQSVVYAVNVGISVLLLPAAARMKFGSKKRRA